MRMLNSSEVLCVSGGLVNTNGVDDSGMFKVLGQNKDSNQVGSCPKGAFEIRPDEYQERSGGPGDCARLPTPEEIGDAADALSIAMQAKALKSTGKTAVLWGAAALAADAVSTVAGWFEDKGE